MGFIRRMSGYAENCALCKFLHSKFSLYIRRIDTVFLEFIHQCTATDAQH